MKGRAYVVAVWVLLLGVTMLAQSPKNPANPLEPIAWTVGDWHATATPPDGRPVQINNHIYWSETRTAIFFLTRFDGQPHYSGMYAYDPGRKQISFWYVDEAGNFTEGVARPEGKRLVQDFTGTRADGSQQTLRSYLEPNAESTSYHWQVLRDDNPKPLIELDYTRKK